MASHLLIEALILAKLTTLAVVALPPGPSHDRHVVASRPALAAPKRSGGRPIILRMGERHAQNRTLVVGPEPRS